MHLVGVDGGAFESANRPAKTVPKTLLASLHMNRSRRRYAGGIGCETVPQSAVSLRRHHRRDHRPASLNRLPLHRLEQAGRSDKTVDDSAKR